MKGLNKKLNSEFTLDEVTKALNELVEAGELKAVLKDGEIAYINPTLNYTGRGENEKTEAGLRGIQGIGEGLRETGEGPSPAIRFSLLPYLEVDSFPGWLP